jgi:hypothetical protein
MTESPVSPAPLPTERKATLRLGQRELSLISIGAIVISVAIVAFFGYRIYLNFRITRDLIVAENNLRALYTAMHSGYAQDWEGKLPTAEKWVDQTAGYISAPPNTPGGPRAYLQGPADAGKVGYVFNDLASGYNVETGKNARGEVINPSRLVLLIERPGVAPDVSTHTSIPLQGNLPGEQALLKELRFVHNSDDTKTATTVILFANGRVQRLERRDFEQ